MLKASSRELSGYFRNILLGGALAFCENALYRPMDIISTVIQSGPECMRRKRRQAAWQISSATKGPASVLLTLPLT
jgi:hypothetical protein